MVAIAVSKSSQYMQVISPGKQVVLQGSLPGEGTLKGQAVSIKVVADDGVHRRHIRLTKKIGEGGEGSVFETDLATKSSYVAKVYSRRKLVDTKIDKIKLMLTKSIELAGVCFPVALIKNELSEPVGFLMPRANGVELGKSVFMPKLLQLKFPSWTRRDTIQLCITILEKIKYLNERGIILGDINGQNILIVSPTEVYFVDCDSYQIGRYPCPAGTPHFTAPEAQGRDYNTFLRTQAMENFAIATLLFMIMLPGKSPYAAVGGASPAENIRSGNFAYESNDNSKIPPGKWGFIWSHMSYNTRTAFVDTFRKDGQFFAPNKRMDAEQWLDVFKAYQHGINHMLERDPMAMDIFPTRLKKRECKRCHNMFIPNPNRYSPICPDCERKEVWKSYPCSNPKCNNTITLYNRDKVRYQNKHLPEYCSACWQSTPCRRCGYMIAKWMYDEKDGLCRKCYRHQHSKRKKAAPIKSAHQTRMAAQSTHQSARLSNMHAPSATKATIQPKSVNSSPRNQNSNKESDNNKLILIFVIILLIFIMLAPIYFAVSWYLSLHS